MLTIKNFDKISGITVCGDEWKLYTFNFASDKYYKMILLRNTNIILPYPKYTINIHRGLTSYRDGGESYQMSIHYTHNKSSNIIKEYFTFNAETDAENADIFIEYINSKIKLMQLKYKQP